MKFMMTSDVFDRITELHAQRKSWREIKDIIGYPKTYNALHSLYSSHKKKKVKNPVSTGTALKTDLKSLLSAELTRLNSEIEHLNNELEIFRQVKSAREQVEKLKAELENSIKEEESAMSNLTENRQEPPEIPPKTDLDSKPDVEPHGNETEPPEPPKDETVTPKSDSFLHGVNVEFNEEGKAIITDNVIDYIRILLEELESDDMEYEDIQEETGLSFDDIIDIQDGVIVKSDEVLDDEV